MKKLFTIIFLSIAFNSFAQPSNWENFSATSCDGVTKSIKGTLEETQKPIILMWKGYDCGFCREEGKACATSAQTYGNVINYWSAFGRINGNGTCNEATSWKNEYGDPSTNFVFLDKLAEDNWSQPSPGQGRWYFVISIDKTTKSPKMISSGNIIKDIETSARKATRDFPTANEGVSALIVGSEVFPNPTSDVLNIKLDLKYTSDLIVEVKDLVGKSLITLANGQYKNYSQQVDVSSYEKGVYILSYTIDGMTQTQKIQIK
jgi:hypothetical protein